METIAERILHVIGSIAVIGILWVEIDDVYGLTNIRKLSKRRWRKFLRDFFKASKNYFKKKPVETPSV